MKDDIIAAALDKHPREKYIGDREGADEWWENVVADLYDTIIEELYHRNQLRDE